MQKNYDSTIRHLIFWFLFFVIGFISLATVTDMFRDAEENDAFWAVFFLILITVVFYIGYVTGKFNERKRNEKKKIEEINKMRYKKAI